MGSIFGVPSMLFWGGAIALPILIHLFTRQRYRKVPWAAMEFLLRAFKKTQRRIRLEHLLLLLLRILAILFFVLALADPRIGSGGLGGGPDQRREVVIILDDSYSMGVASPEGGTPLARAKGQADRLLRGLQRERGDSVSLVLAGSSARLSLKEVTDLDRAAAVIAETETSDGGTDIVGALRVTVAILDDLEPGAEVFLLSDLQRVGFNPPADLAVGSTTTDEGATAEQPPQQMIASLVQEVRARKAVLTLIAPAAGTTDNVVVQSLALKSKTAVTGTSVAFGCTVRNFGERAQGGSVRFFVDGASDPVDQRELELIPPGGLMSVDFRHVFRTEGSHYVETRFLSDGLEIDNRRVLSIEIRRKLRTLVVDGDPGETPSQAESFFFQAAMSPGGDRLSESEFEVTAIREPALDTQNLADVDLLVLMDVSLISTASADAIQKFVSEGGGLLVFVGDKTKPESLNHSLWRNGAGVLPAELQTEVGEDSLMDLPFSLTRPLLTHEALAYFSDPAIEPWLTVPPIYRYVRVTPKDDPTVQVLASVERPEAALPNPDPLILERVTGKGKCILVTTSGGDREWNEIQALPTYLLLVRELAYHLTRRDQRVENLVVGQSYTRTLKSFVREVVVSRDGQQISVIAPLVLENNAGHELKTGVLDRAGIYRCDLSSEGDALTDPSPLHIAVNVDPSEGDLARVDANFLAGSIPGGGIRVAADVDEADEEVGPGRDRHLWWWFLVLGAACLALETALSQIFGARSRGAAA